MTRVTWKRLLFAGPAVAAVTAIVVHFSLVGSAAQTTAGQDNQTAWDSYKNRPFSPSTD